MGPVVVVPASADRRLGRGRAVQARDLQNKSSDGGREGATMQETRSCILGVFFACFAPLREMYSKSSCAQRRKARKENAKGIGFASVVAVLFFVLPGPAADWPQFRGPNGTAVSSETGLPT